MPEVFLLAILISACDSSSPTFCMIYSTYKLNKQASNMQSWHAPFPISSQSIVLCLVLFLLELHIGFSWGNKVVWYSHLFKNFPQFAVIHIVKGFSVVNEAEVDVFLETSCFFYDPTDAFLWNWNENWPFPVLWPLLGFPNFLIKHGTLERRIANHFSILALRMP